MPAMPYAAIAAVALALTAAPALAQTGCGQPAKDAVTSVALPAPPLAVAATRDGCSIFVSLPAAGSSPGQIALVSRAGGAATVARTLATPGPVAGLALSGDGKVLAAAVGHGVALYDVARFTAGLPDLLIAVLEEGDKAASADVIFSGDDKLLFVANQGANTLGVYDVAARKRLSAVQVGRFPGGLALSPDGQALYVVARFVDGRSPDCSPEDGQGSWSAPGELVVVDPAKAATSPATAVIGRATAGCAPARVAVSPNGDLAYVTARGDDVVLVIRTDRALTDRTHAGVGRLKVGALPDGVAASGRFVFVANADSGVAVLGAGDQTTMAGAIPITGLTRDVAATADGSALLVTVAGANSLQIVDLARLGQFRR